VRKKAYPLYKWATSFILKPSSKLFATPWKKQVALLLSRKSLGSADDKERTVYIERALNGVANCLKDDSMCAVTFTGQPLTILSGQWVIVQRLDLSGLTARHKNAR
jgi:hypothetical protein